MTQGIVPAFRLVHDDDIDSLFIVTPDGETAALIPGPLTARDRKHAALFITAPALYDALYNVINGELHKGTWDAARAALKAARGEL